VPGAGPLNIARGWEFDVIGVLEFDCGVVVLLVVASAIAAPPTAAAPTAAPVTSIDLIFFHVLHTPLLSSHPHR